MMAFSAMAAKWIPSWEVIDYAGAGKADAPSGTARELAHRLAAVGRPEQPVPVDQVQGEPEARGANLGGTQVHSVRLPQYTLGVEALFGQTGESLSIRHDAGTSAEPYVGGVLLAIQGVDQLRGLHRGLDAVMELG
jgi:4-hydroxy-tetrahydrodipicolinate reductase